MSGLEKNRDNRSGTEAVMLISDEWQVSWMSWLLITGRGGKREPCCRLFYGYIFRDSLSETGYG